MVVLGLLLVLAAIAAGALAVYGLPGGQSNIVKWDFLGNSLSLSPTAIFFIGVAATLALALGLWLMSLGARASARKRRELKQLRRDQKEFDRRDREHNVELERTQRDQANREAAFDRERADRDQALQHERTQRAIAEQENREQARRTDGGSSSVGR